MAKDENRYKHALRLGEAFNDKQDWNKAVGAFRVAVGEFPKRSEPYAGLAQACFGLKQIDRALECYKLAARYSGGKIEYLRKVADMQERLGQLDDAAKTYMAAGELMLRQRNLDEAVSNWERAIRLQANLLGAHQRLAMVFQRQKDTRGAVREYLAIARILQARGQKEKALRMCQAALRLDPGNNDVLTAIELVRHGEGAFAQVAEEPEPDPIVVKEPEPSPPSTNGDEISLADTVRQMATIFEKERLANKTGSLPQPTIDPTNEASRLAQEHLAEEIFREEEDEALLYGTGSATMSKLERDALIGQGMDFQNRAQPGDAIECFKKAIAGGLNLPAAHFTLGMLYCETENGTAARPHLLIAAKDAQYQAASEHLLRQISS